MASPLGTARGSVSTTIALSPSTSSPTPFEIQAAVTERLDHP
jgi:hypothetical protein